MTTAVSPTFRRDLPEYMTVSLDGVVTGVDPQITDRMPGRVVLTMPDFAADNLGRVLAKVWRVARAMSDQSFGQTERALAEALVAAAEVGGFRCPLGGLSLPPDDHLP
jgi:hypothetical protein